MFTDKTGEPRSDEEIREAIQAVGRMLVKDALALPYLTIQAGVILDGLRELLRRRETSK